MWPWHCQFIFDLWVWLSLWYFSSLFYTNMSLTTGATCTAGSAYSPVAPEITLSFRWGLCWLCCVLCTIVCRFSHSVVSYFRLISLNVPWYFSPNYFKLNHFYKNKIWIWKPNFCSTCMYHHIPLTLFSRCCCLYKVMKTFDDLSNRIFLR